MRVKKQAVRAIAASAAMLATSAVVAAPSAQGSPLDACWHPDSTASAVHVNGQGEASGDLVCTFTAFSRGGVTAVTPNAWEVYNVTRSCVVATSAGGPAQSFGDRVAPGDTVRVTMFDQLQTGQADAGTFGLIRAGGAGQVADDQPGC